jgi:uncharacterized protein YdiU (UPF0061 family)
VLTRLAVRQARLIAFWLNVSLTGAMANIDNMTFSDETVNYGLGAFMEAYDPAAAVSSIDRGGRHAYANQPTIARGNRSLAGCSAGERVACWKTAPARVTAGYCSFCGT